MGNLDYWSGIDTRTLNCTLIETNRAEQKLGSFSCEQKIKVSIRLVK